MAFLHEHIILPLSDLLKGESVHKYLRLLREAEGWSDEQMHDFQQRRLAMLLQYSAEKVPFYRDWFHSQGLDPRTATLDHLPIVDKALMRREGISRFAAEGFPERERLISRSSGSTGEPFTFYETRLSYSVNMASKLRTWYQAGYRLGDRYMKITNGKRSKRIKALQDKINNCIYLPFYSITDGTLADILTQIEFTKPCQIRSYPAPLYLLAQYRNNHKGFNHCPKHIFTTGSTITDAYREEIERAFGCDIIDSYSCEGTPNTYETPVHDGYHICKYYGIIEVLDETGQPINDGIGRVVSTDLWNFAHPFIRYDTQDLVKIHNGQIQQILGRQCECLLTVSGQTITIHNLTTFFASQVTSVTAYRMVKRKDGYVEFLITVNEEYSDSDKEKIISYWHNLLQTPVIVTIVDDIPMMHNNKRLTIINETTD